LLNAIARQSARVGAAETRLRGPKPRRLHRLRIELKKLRYQLECLEPLGLPSLPSTLALLKPRQDLLGELQDAAVMRGLLERRRKKAAAKKQRRRAAAEAAALVMVEQRSEALYGSLMVAEAEHPSATFAAPIEKELTIDN
jgi:CHAD domain-containing protein